MHYYLSVMNDRQCFINKQMSKKYVKIKTNTISVQTRGVTIHGLT